MAYRVSCQYAHHDHSESEDLGTMGSADVLRRVRLVAGSRRRPIVSQCRLAKLELDTQDFKQGDARRALELFMRGQDGELKALYR